jgi:hypothetical protein
MERAAGVSAGAPVWHAGSCHCGRVRIEALAPPDLELLECNCSMCSRSAYLHLIVTADEFRLLAGADDLVEYSFGTGVAKHRFCRRCGVKPFYVPRSHPDGYSVNARCLDPSSINSMRIRSFDGRDWEKARSDLDSSA